MNTRGRSWWRQVNGERGERERGAAARRSLDQLVAPSNLVAPGRPLSSSPRLEVGAPLHPFPPSHYGDWLPTQTLPPQCVLPLRADQSAPVCMTRTHRPSRSPLKASALCDLCNGARQGGPDTGWHAGPDAACITRARAEMVGTCACARRVCVWLRLEGLCGPYASFFLDMKNLIWGRRLRGFKL